MKSLKKSMHFLIVLVIIMTNVLILHAEELKLSASSAIAIDYETGDILYEKDIDTMRVPASMTKIMTAYIIFEELANGNLTKDTMITVSPESAATSRNKAYPMPVALQSGGQYSVNTLLDL